MSKPELDHAAAGQVCGQGLHERFRFDSFVPGPANEFAHSVAKRVAGWSDGHFNPVVFHGPYGFGKTHLLNAIAWEAMRTAPHRKVIYLTAERFLTSFVRAMMDRTGPAFKEELRTADLLLIDERDGYRVARRKGLSVTGTPGLLDLAAEQGLIDFVQA